MEPFSRDFFDQDRRRTWIGSGHVGGKAQGLVSINEVLSKEFSVDSFPGFEVGIPNLTVIRTDVFDAFLRQGGLSDIAYSDSPDDLIAHEFQKGTLPVEILGDLRSLVEKVKSPLAVRSSSLLEDALYEPFAGVYTTKMLPNNQPGADERFRRLAEAVKLVYASTFFAAAKDYIRAVGRQPEEEKMAVLIQEVVGNRYRDRFYPQLSGVARSYHYYAMGRMRPEQGVVSLALGLGKTIVEGDKCWTYSPAFPSVPPPVGSVRELLGQTQSGFWAVNMGKPPAYDPIRETEYLSRLELSHAEADGTLNLIASTYDAHADKLSMGIGAKGPRVLDFSGVLRTRDIPLNDLIRAVLKMCEERFQRPVEMEFAATLNPHRFAFLQVRPMVVSGADVTVAETEMEGDNVLLASDSALGNGLLETIRDVVYLKPDPFDSKFSPRIAVEVEKINRKLLLQNRHYVLIGFGRWGSADPWLGVPVNWGQVCGAKVIVEASREDRMVDLSQGSHFFHNLISFQVCYLNLSHTKKFSVHWDQLTQQHTEEETEFVRHVVFETPLRVKVDGRTGRGVILIASDDFRSGP